MDDKELEMYERFGFVEKGRYKDLWDRFGFQIEIYDEHTVLVCSGIGCDFDALWAAAKRPKNDDDLKLLYKALTGNELTESGFKLSI